MSKKLFITVLAAASLSAACTSAGPTEPPARDASAVRPHLDEGTPPPPADTTTRCGGMLGSGTRC
jgi:hypothetical protein